MLTVGAVGYPYGGELPSMHSPLLARGAMLLAACFFAGFFAVHYGLFTNVHGVFVFVLFAPEMRGTILHGSGLWEGIFLETFHLAWQGVAGGFATPVAAIFLSHGFSFAYNFLYLGEHRRVGLPQLMVAPYGRVIVMHVAILFGAWAVLLLSSPAILVALLVLLKTGLDIAFHTLERQKGAIAPFAKR
jgi:hypothetical protein